MASHSSIKLAEGFAKKMEEQVRKEFVPNFEMKPELNPLTFHFFDLQYLAGVWSTIREAVIATGQFKRADKEIFATFVSKSNECKFCVSSHTNMAKAMGADNTVYKADVKNDPSLLSDKKIGAISQWLMSAQEKKSPVLKEAPPFSREEAPEVIVTAFYFNYVNRIVDTFITRDEFLPETPSFMKLAFKTIPFGKGALNNVVKNQFSGTVSGPPGLSGELVASDIAIPEDLKWLSPNPHIQKAMALFRAACEEAGKKYISDGVREFVGNYIKEKYDGGKTPLSKKWVFNAADSFGGTGADRSAIVFMLLVSFSRFQIDDQLEKDLEERYPDENTKRAMGMWAAYQTARRAAEWQAAALDMIK